MKSMIPRLLHAGRDRRFLASPASKSARTASPSPAAVVARARTLKTTLGYRDSFIGEGQISYAGPGAQACAQLAARSCASAGADRRADRRAAPGPDRRERHQRCADVGGMHPSHRKSACAWPGHGQHERGDTHRQRGRDALHQRPGWWRWRDQGRPRGHCRARCCCRAAWYIHPFISRRSEMQLRRDRPFAPGTRATFPISR
jgi:hypothetical protein